MYRVDNNLYPGRVIRYSSPGKAACIATAPSNTAGPKPGLRNGMGPIYRSGSPRYRLTPKTATALATVDPGGATRWRF